MLHKLNDDKKYDFEITFVLDKRCCMKKDIRYKHCICYNNNNNNEYINTAQNRKSSDALGAAETGVSVVFAQKYVLIRTASMVPGVAVL